MKLFAKVNLCRNGVRVCLQFLWSNRNPTDCHGHIRVRSGTDPGLLSQCSIPESDVTANVEIHFLHTEIVILLLTQIQVQVLQNEYISII